MAYTHTFELDINSIKMEGELDFGETALHPRIRTESDLEIPLEEWKLVYDFFSMLTKMFCTCHRDIHKIEVLEK